MIFPEDIQRLQEIDDQPTAIEMRMNLAEDAKLRRYSEKIILAIMGLIDNPDDEYLLTIEE